MRIKRLFYTVFDCLICSGVFCFGSIACGVIGAIIYGFIYPGVEQVPEPWSTRIVYLAMVGGIVLAVFVWKKLRSRRKIGQVSPREQTSRTTKVPSSKKKQTELAESILANIEICVSLANKSSMVSNFIDWYDEALDGFAQLMMLNKVQFKSSPTLDYYRLKDEFQWHLCDAIVRAKEEAISDIQDKYKNSREFQRRTANTFAQDIDIIRNRFSEDTAALADKSIGEVNKAAGIMCTQTDFESLDCPMDQFAKYGGIDAELLTIDLMEGHDFEHWCAELLSDIGFTDVIVTKASGDQGVDVLAQKDGVKYAIQCKCYSHDLDNKPVQEVNAGKSMPQYHCQIGAVMTNRYFTKSAHELAEVNGVLLWDRDWLQCAIKQRNQT